MERDSSSSKAGCHCAAGGQLFGKLSKVPSIFGYGMGSHIKTKRQREKRRMGRNSPALSPCIWSGFWYSNPWRRRKHHNQGEASQRVLDPLFHLEFANIAHKKRTPSRSPLFLFSGGIPLFVTGLVLFSPRVDILAGRYAEHPFKCPAEGGIAGVASLFGNRFYG